MSTIRTAYNDEIIEIWFTAEQLFYFIDKFTDVVILSDSRVTVYSTESIDSPTSSDVLKCQNFIRKLHQLAKSVTFQWIPDNCRIMGNEKAGAKKGIFIQ